MEENFDPIAYANSVGRDLISAFEKADLATTPGLVGDAKEKHQRTNWDTSFLQESQSDLVVSLTVMERQVNRWMSCFMKRTFVLFIQ